MVVYLHPQGRVVQLQELVEDTNRRWRELGTAWFGYPQAQEAAPKLTPDEAEAKFKNLIRTRNHYIFEQIDYMTALASLLHRMNEVISFGAVAHYRDQPDRQKLIVMANAGEIHRYLKRAVSFVTRLNDETVELCGFGPEVDYMKQARAEEKIKQVGEEILRADRWRDGVYKDEDDRMDHQAYSQTLSLDPLGLFEEAEMGDFQHRKNIVPEFQLVSGA